MPTQTSTKFASRLMHAGRLLEESKRYASPTEWARVHDIQARIATTLGLRRAFNVKRKQRAHRKARKKKES